MPYAWPLGRCVLIDRESIGWLDGDACMAISLPEILMLLIPYQVEFAAPGSGETVLTADGDILTADGEEITWQ